MRYVIYNIHSSTILIFGPAEKTCKHTNVNENTHVKKGLQGIICVPLLLFSATNASTVTVLLNVITCVHCLLV